VLALFWSRMTGAGFVWGTVLGIAIGMPIRSAYGELVGSLAILSISAAVPLVLGLFGSERYDFEKLKKLPDATDSAAPGSEPPLPAAPLAT
jgi:urea-proton symporter